MSVSGLISSFHRSLLFLLSYFCLMLLIRFMPFIMINDLKVNITVLQTPFPHISPPRGVSFHKTLWMKITYCAKNEDKCLCTYCTVIFLEFFYSCKQMVFITADVMNVSSGPLQAWLPNMCFCCAAFGQVLPLLAKIKTYLSKKQRQIMSLHDFWQICLKLCITHEKKKTRD